MVDIALEPKGLNLAADRIHETELISYLGTIDADAVVRTVVTGAFQSPAADVIDLKNIDLLILIVDIVLSNSAAHRVRVLFGKDDASAKLDQQETRSDDSVANEVRYEFIDHVFTADGRYIVEIARLNRFAKIEFKGDGAPDANDKMAIGLIGQLRRGG